MTLASAEFLNQEDSRRPECRPGPNRGAFFIILSGHIYLAIDQLETSRLHVQIDGDTTKITAEGIVSGERTRQHVENVIFQTVGERRFQWVLVACK